MDAPPDVRDDPWLQNFRFGDHLSNMMPTRVFLNGNGNKFYPVPKMIVGISHQQEVSHLARTLNIEPLQFQTLG